MFRYLLPDGKMDKASTFGDALLAHTCPNVHKGDLRRFEINLKCTFAYIIARVVNKDPLEYDVIYLDLQTHPNDEALQKCIAMFDGMP